MTSRTLLLTKLAFFNDDNFLSAYQYDFFYAFTLLSNNDFLKHFILKKQKTKTIERTFPSRSCSVLPKKWAFVKYLWGVKGNITVSTV